jgi:hypothetical protein
MTLDQLIAKLEIVRDILGGDTPVVMPDGESVVHVDGWPDSKEIYRRVVITDRLPAEAE